jgi:ferritin-like protein
VQGDADADLEDYPDDGFDFVILSQTLQATRQPRVVLEGEGLKQIAEDARIEDRNHFEALVPRIYELGGKLPANMVDFHNMSACPPASLPKDPTDIKAMLEVLLKAEQCAVRGYTAVCNMTFGKDHRTYDLALAILHEEIEHEAWFAEFLGHGPSGHYSREGRPNSPLCWEVPQRRTKLRRTRPETRSGHGALKYPIGSRSAARP